MKYNFVFWHLTLSVLILWPLLCMYTFYGYMFKYITPEHITCSSTYDKLIDTSFIIADLIQSC